jgi:hypothetical protein
VLLLKFSNLHIAFTRQRGSALNNSCYNNKDEDEEEEEGEETKLKGETTTMTKMMTTIYGSVQLEIFARGKTIFNLFMTVIFTKCILNHSFF